MGNPAYYAVMVKLQPKKKHTADSRWVVHGFDGTKALFQQTLPAASWPEPRVAALLQRLLSRHLSADDIMDGSRAPRDQFYSPVLKDRRSVKGRITITVGENPFYVATRYQADEESD
jgi:hypothetical protein